MNKHLNKAARDNPIKGWHLGDKDHEHYDFGLEQASRHKGKNCAFVSSRKKAKGEKIPDDAYGHLTQKCAVDQFKGKRLRMTAWAKSELSSEAFARVELNIIGSWGWYCKWNGTFDNLGENPIKGKTDWKQYTLVVDVPEEAISMSFGILMHGEGKTWIDEFNFEVVDKNTPLTGLRSGPINLNFEE